jgi:hypothetical protein
VPLTPYGRALQAPEHGFSVSLRLHGEEMQEVAKVDIASPVPGTYPTSRWAAGEVVGENRELQLPVDLAPGRKRWGVILYRSLEEEGRENLKIEGTGAEMGMAVS